MRWRVSSRQLVRQNQLIVSLQIYFGAQHGIPTPPCTPPHPHKWLSLFFTEFMEKTWILFSLNNYTGLNINNDAIKYIQVKNWTRCAQLIHACFELLFSLLYMRRIRGLPASNEFLCLLWIYHQLRDLLAGTKLEVLSMTFNAVPSFNGHDTS